MNYERSEANARENAGATAGPRAIVSDSTEGIWSDSVSNGDTVRLDALHSVAVNDSILGEDVISPSPMNGGTAMDKVGEVVGYTDDDRVDLAARSIEKERKLYDIEGVVSDEAHEYIGERVTKFGATSGEMRATVMGTNCTTVLTLQDDTRYAKLTELVILSCEPTGSDSGGPVLHDGELFGMTIGGIGDITFVQYAPHMEAALGVDVSAAY